VVQAIEIDEFDVCAVLCVAADFVGESGREEQKYRKGSASAKSGQCTLQGA
jgi:hypothetical protein